jgi:hypothetical protein
MTSDTTASAHPKASDRLAHPRYSRRWRLSSHVGSCRDPIGRSKQIQAMLLAKRRMILLKGPETN